VVCRNIVKGNVLVVDSINVYWDVWPGSVLLLLLAM